MADLIYMMNTLVDNKGQILVPGIMDDVVPITDEELATYTSIDFDLEHYKKDIGCKHLLHKTDKVMYCHQRNRLVIQSIYYGMFLVQNSYASMEIPGSVNAWNPRGFQRARC